MSTSEFKPVNLFVRAGAGAGKTWNLTRQVVGLAMDFYEKEGRWPKVVLTTFTRKATQELKERMLIYCLQEKREALEFVSSSTYLQITTMHGLMSVFLGRYSSRLGFPTQLKIVDQNQGTYWRKQILKELIEENKVPQELKYFDVKRLTSYLNEFEKYNSSQKTSPVDSEKDIEKLSQMFCQTLSQDFKDFGQLSQGEVFGEKWDLFFDQLRLVIKTLESDMPWLDKTLKVPDQIEELKKLKPRKSKNVPGLSENLSKRLIELRALADKWFLSNEYSHELWKQRLEILKSFNQLGLEFTKRLFDKKRSEGSVETNDLEFFSLKLVKEYPEAAKSFSESVDAWFIDEFQDTSPLQMEILNQLIGQKSCYMVGDPQQSIYLFRGSRSEVFYDELDRKTKSGAEVKFLQNNYRSQAHLLEFFNEVFPKLSDDFSTMDPQVNGLEDRVAVEFQHLEKAELETEIHLLSEQLAELLNIGCNPKDIAILFRNRKQMALVQQKLLSLGFPVLSHASTQFYSRREILDAMALLRLLMNPWDNKNLILLLRSPWFELTDRELTQLISGEKEAYWPKVKTYWLENSKVGSKVLKIMDELPVKGYAICLRELLIELGLFDYSLKADPSGRREANLWKLVNQVEKMAREPGLLLSEFVKNQKFVQSLDDVGDEGDAPSALEPNKINLMTVHASKGLQFKNVFLPFLHKKPNKTTYQEFTFHEDFKKWDMRLPLVKSNEFKESFLEYLQLRELKKREKQEALRVLYVAMTRAEEKLYLSWQGEPERDSWAEALQVFKSSWLENKQIKVVEGHQPTATAFDNKTQASNVRAPLEDIPLHEVRSEATENAIRNWEAVQKAQQVRQRGVVLHKIFEALKYHNRESLYALSELWMPEQKDLVQKALDYIMDHDQVPFLDLISQGEVEWGYLKRTLEIKQEKRIDLWSIHDDCLWVVDYKTGSPNFKDKAFDQMSEYAETLKEYLNWEKPIKMCAVFPFSESHFVREFN